MKKLIKSFYVVLVMLVLLLTACGTNSSNVNVTNSGNVCGAVTNVVTTANGQVSGLSVVQEAIYRLTDANDCRLGLLPATDARNLGMGELVGELTQGEYNGTPEPAHTLLLTVTPIYWGSNTGGHSEELSDNNLLQFVNSGQVDTSRITRVWMIVVTQYNACSACVQHVRQTARAISNKLRNIAVQVSLWMVNRFIDPLNSKTWVAPSSPGDVTQVLR